MSDNVPEGLGAEPGRTTVNLAQSNTLFEALTGVPLDEKKLNSRMAADRAFLRTGNQVLDALRKASDGSAFTQDVRATFMNLFTVSDSVASQAVKAGKKAFEELGIYNPNDYVSAESRERIEDATEQFLQQEFLANDAVLASSLVKFAYSFAKTMDEAGRISERDYIAALAAVNADFLGDAVGIHVGGDQLIPVRGVNAVKAGVGRRRAGNAHMHLTGAGIAHHGNDLA